MILSVLAALTFVLQGYSAGFKGGHYGWVSAHVLAQITHATPENQFLGYTMPIIRENGDRDLVYFDRYPVFFSGGMNLALSAFFKSDLASQIQGARILMNIIYVMMLFVSYLLLNAIFDRPIFSLLATVFVLGTTTILFYRDMIHFDQPALLGILILLWAIARFELHGDKKSIWWAALFASVIGRGYSSVFFLILWVAVRLYRHRQWHREISAYILASAVLFSGACLMWNIASEARIRNVTWAETSIVVSATSRLSIKKGTDELERKARFSKVIVLQLEGFYKNLIPALFGGPEQLIKKLRKMGHSNFGLAGLLLLAAFLIWLSIRMWREWKTLPPPLKFVGAVMILGGPFWGIIMRKLTAYHDYTQMYLIPANLFLCFLLFQSFGLLARERVRAVFLVGTIVIFVSSLLVIRNIHNQQAEIANIVTSDLQNIVAQLPLEGAKIFIQDGHSKLIDGVPFASGFYFSKHWMMEVDQGAQYKVVRDPTFAASSLTPENKFLYLVKAD